MRRSRALVSAVFLVLSLRCNAPADAHEKASDAEVLAERWADLALTTNCEAGFRRFMHMAQTGQIGADVTNANIGVMKNHVRLELVRTGAPNKLLLLTPKSSAHSPARYFNIEPGPGVTADDVARVARGLDQAFGEDPFQLTYDFFSAVPGGDPIPRLIDAWTSDGWKGVMRALERRMAALAGLRYTMGVIVALGTALLASLFVLWGSTPFLLTSRGRGPGGSV